MYRCGSCSPRVEVEGEETDGDVQGFAWYFMAVNERAPVSVDGDKAEGGGGPGYGAPVGGICRSGGGRGEMAVGLGSFAV